MCGINLILDKKQNLSSDEPIRQMIAATRHRGPDAEAWVQVQHAYGRAWLGNSRLKMIDHSEAGNQPMRCGPKGQEGDRYTLSYNGEIYNYFELKNELLQAGYQFKSHTDTEVLLYALCEWGEGALSRLNGMYAFVFTDQASGRLWMARDPRGMKPLYYCHTGQFLLASSELRGLFASGLIEKKLNSVQVRHYLQFRYARKPSTFFEGVLELLPGQLLQYESNGGKPELVTFQPANKTETDHLRNFNLSQEATILDAVEEKLTDALFSHMHANRGSGLFLSGGIDSTLLLALLRHNASNELPLCFTIANSPQDAAWGTHDYQWATKAAKQYNAAHFPLEIDSTTILTQFAEFVAEQDQPVGDGAAWLTSMLSKEAAKQVGLVLSGAGADELFGGYNRHQAFATYLRYHKQMRWLLPALKPIGSQLPVNRLPFIRKPLRLVKKLVKETSLDPDETFTNYISFEALGKVESTSLSSYLHGEGDFEERWLQAALTHERENFLISDILALNDKASMQHSLEMRMPYLDYNLWSLAASLPASLHLQNGKKWILRKLLTRHAGEAYTKRPKEGFGMPFGRWVKDGRADFLFEWIEDANHPVLDFVAPDDIRTLISLHKKGQEDFGQELFSLTLLAHWLQKEFA